MSIDWNRGATKRSTPANVVVVEFRDEPGAYYDANGRPIEERYAQDAGFDVAAGKKERLRRQLRKEAEERIEKQLAKELGEADKTAEERQRIVDEATDQPRKVPGKGKDKFDVLDASGEMVAENMTERAADELLDELRRAS